MTNSVNNQVSFTIRPDIQSLDVCNLTLAGKLILHAYSAGTIDIIATRLKNMVKSKQMSQEKRWKFLSFKCSDYCNENGIKANHKLAKSMLTENDLDYDSPAFIEGGSTYSAPKKSNAFVYKNMTQQDRYNAAEAWENDMRKLYPNKNNPHATFLHKSTQILFLKNHKETMKHLSHYWYLLMTRGVITDKQRIDETIKFDSGKDESIEEMVSEFVYTDSISQEEKKKSLPYLQIISKYKKSEEVNKQ